MTTFTAFWRCNSGATSIEYAMIAGLVSLAIVAGATAIGTRLAAKFVPISQNLS